MVVLDTTKSDFHIKASSLRKDEVFNLLVYMSALQSFCKILLKPIQKGLYCLQKPSSFISNFKSAPSPTILRMSLPGHHTLILSFFTKQFPTESENCVTYILKMKASFLNHTQNLFYKISLSLSLSLSLSRQFFGPLID